MKLLIQNNLTIADMIKYKGKTKYLLKESRRFKLAVVHSISIECI